MRSLADWCLAVDEDLLLHLIELAGTSSLLDSFFRLFVNDYFVPVVLSLFLFGLWFWGKDQSQREKNQRTVLSASVSLALVNIVVKLMNTLSWGDRERPFEALEELWINAENMVMPPHLFYAPTDPSFPSNIAAVAFAIAASVWISHRKAGLLLFVPASLVCLARVVAGVHYPLDVLAGAGLGLLTAYLVTDLVMPLLKPIVERGLRVARKLCLA